MSFSIFQAIGQLLSFCDQFMQKTDFINRLLHHYASTLMVCWLASERNTDIAKTKQKAGF